MKLHSMFILLQVDKSSIKVKGIKRQANKTGGSLPSAGCSAAENELHNIQPETMSSLRSKTVEIASLTENFLREGTQVLLTNIFATFLKTLIFCLFEANQVLFIYG